MHFSTSKDGGQAPISELEWSHSQSLTQSEYRDAGMNLLNHSRRLLDGKRRYLKYVNFVMEHNIIIIAITLTQIAREGNKSRYRVDKASTKTNLETNHVK